jgi:hypothetical protein
LRSKDHASALPDWLAHYLDFSAERFLSTMPKLLEQPFWLDPGDPHRMAAVMQFLRGPRLSYIAIEAFVVSHQAASLTA